MDKYIKIIIDGSEFWYLPNKILSESDGIKVFHAIKAFCSLNCVVFIDDKGNVVDWDYNDDDY